MGDALQSASVFPWLKANGYYITMYCVPNGYEVLKADPHVDRFIVQDVDMIPNEWLGSFVAHLEKTNDKVINFSESVERTLLAMPGNTNHAWSYEMRHKHLNKNYLEFMHDIAGVPYEPKVRFYPTEYERAWANAEYDRIGGKVILWALGGSAIHKHWPNLDEAIAEVANDDVHVVTVGDKLCKIQERGLETNPNVILRSWMWTMRQSMAFAQVCDLVIGTETGLLNAVSFERVPKIVTLSHSSVENLTRDWVNTASLTPEATPCYPCHRMHFGFDHCTKGIRDGELVGAACQLNISAERMVKAIRLWLNMKKEVSA